MNANLITLYDTLYDMESEKKLFFYMDFQRDVVNLFNILVKNNINYTNFKKV